MVVAVIPSVAKMLVPDAAGCWQLAIQAFTAAVFVLVPETLIGLYTDGQLDVDGLVTKTYTLDGVNDGYDDMRAGKNIRGVLVYD